MAKKAAKKAAKKRSAGKAKRAVKKVGKKMMAKAGLSKAAVKKKVVKKLKSVGVAMARAAMDELMPPEQGQAGSGANSTKGAKKGGAAAPRPR